MFLFTFGLKKIWYILFFLILEKLTNSWMILCNSQLTSIFNWPKHLCCQLLWALECLSDGSLIPGREEAMCAFYFSYIPSQYTPVLPAGVVVPQLKLLIDWRYTDPASFHPACFSRPKCFKAVLSYWAQICPFSSLLAWPLLPCSWIDPRSWK